MIAIDGSMGEGGGQIVRTALSLALVTGRSIRVENIRAGRRRPGLRPQHVAAVRAAAAIGAADAAPAEGDRTLTFAPQTVEPGSYHFEVGTAGSAVLVLQTVLPPLLTARGPSTVTVDGGTHIPYAPPFPFLADTVLPLLQRMGPTLRATLHRPGFYPVGGGRCTVEVEPVARLAPLRLLERGRLKRRWARAILSNLPRHIAERELEMLRTALPLGPDETHIDTPSAAGAGNALLVWLDYEHVVTVLSVIGEKGIPAEQVAQSVVDAVRAYTASPAPVGPYLADQLLVPLVMGGGAYRTSTLTSHTHTNAAVIERILGPCLAVESAAGGWVLSAAPHDAAPSTTETS